MFPTESYSEHFSSSFLRGIRPHHLDASKRFIIALYSRGQVVGHPWRVEYGLILCINQRTCCLRFNIHTTLFTGLSFGILCAFILVVWYSLSMQLEIKASWCGVFPPVLITCLWTWTGSFLMYGALNTFTVTLSSVNFCY